MKKQFIIGSSIVFVVITAILIAMRIFAPAFDFVALETGNVIMMVLALSAYVIVKKQIDGRPEAFVRGVNSASFLKLMVCMISILVYVLLNRSHIHKPSVFVMFGIYALYTVVETIMLSKMARE